MNATFIPIDKIQQNGDGCQNGFFDSSLSCSASPSMLHARTVMNMVIPGNIMRCGKNLSAVHPSLANTPQLLKGGARPIPTKLRVDSDKMAAGIRNVIVTISKPLRPGSS